MLRKLDHQYLGGSDFDWLETIHHFAFDEAHVNFGVLRILNDDTLAPHSGFENQFQQGLEVLTYVINGELTHTDSLGNKTVLTRGQFQYLSTGSGVTYSEFNHSEEPLRMLQIGITPDSNGHQPTYGDYHFNLEASHNQWHHIASDIHGDAPITLNQDVNIYSIILDEGNIADINVPVGRQAYLMQVEGFSSVNNIALKEKDALEIIEDAIHIEATHTSHFLVIEMPKSPHPYM